MCNTLAMQAPMMAQFVDNRIPARHNRAFPIAIHSMTVHETRNMAVFCDLENVAIGVRDQKYADFDINKVLQRLPVRGNIVVKKAYCDRDRYRDFKQALHEAAFALLEIPHVR